MTATTFQALALVQFFFKVIVPMINSNFMICFKVSPSPIVKLYLHIGLGVFTHRRHPAAPVTYIVFVIRMLSRIHIRRTAH